MNTEWKPIASAPKDGTEILAWRHDCGQFIASYTSADSFPMTQDELDAWDEETLFAKDWFTQWPQALRLEGSEVPTLWQPMPTDPCATCNGHGMIGGPSFYAPDEGGEPCPDCSPPAPTSHPIPTGATGEDERQPDLCPRCDGSGEVTVLSDNSPDAHDVVVCCDHCQGSGAATDAAKYLAAALSGEKYRHMQIWAEYRNFHRSLCARFGYGHDPVHFRRDLVSLEETIAAKVDAPAAGDALGDPALQKLFGEAITGALGFGAQGVNPPPVGHWLEPFWNMARADAALAARLALLDHPLLREVLGYVEDAGPADVWGAAQSWMSLRDAAIAQQSQRKEA